MSVHAAGVVIAPGPLSEYVPVCTAPKGAGARRRRDSIITQYEMGALEKVGMLKMDLLGLKTLTVIHDAVNMIGDRHGTKPDMEALTFDDPKVYAAAPAGADRGGLPVRISAGHRHPAGHEVRPVRRPGGLQRPAAPGPARCRHAHRIHPAQTRAGEGHLPACVTPGGARAHLRRHHLSGAGDADRQRACGVLAWPKRTCSGRR